MVDLIEARRGRPRRRAAAHRGLTGYAVATAQILAILRIPLSLVMFGFALAFAVVPASELRDWLCEFREIQAAGG